LKDIYQAGYQLLQKGEEIVVVTAIGREGSAPRGVGAKMVVTSQKEIIGTIGGGKVEEVLTAEALQLFNSKINGLRSFDMTHEDLVPGHMVCGGKMDFLLEYLAPNQNTLSFFKSILQSYENRDCLLISTAWKSEDESPVICRSMISENGLHEGEFQLGDVSLEQIQLKVEKQKQPERLLVEAGVCWLEPIVDQGRLYLFGAGHVALPVAEIAYQVGFQVTALDDRDKYASVERFPPPMNVKVVKDFEDCLSDLEIDDDSYMVIVTRGHIHDKAVLTQALRTKAGYIGMIGSRKKRGVIYRALKEEGFTEEDLKRVHSPIGLEIKAETPEEIAVSIVAELIQVRAAKLGAK